MKKIVGFVVLIALVVFLAAEDYMLRKNNAMFLVERFDLEKKEIRSYRGVAYDLVYDVRRTVLLKSGIDSLLVMNMIDDYDSLIFYLYECNMNEVRVFNNSIKENSITYIHHESDLTNETGRVTYRPWTEGDQLSVHTGATSTDLDLLMKGNTLGYDGRLFQLAAGREPILTLSFQHDVHMSIGYMRDSIGCFVAMGIRSL